VELSGGEGIEADAVVLACPSRVQGKLLAPIDSALADDLAAIPYAPAVVAVLGYPASSAKGVTDGFGYLSPYRLGRPVLGVIFSSSIFPEQAPPGKVSFRAILGGWGREEVVRWSDERIIETVRSDLAKTLGIVDPPELSWICRWPEAIPQYHLGHRDRVGRVDARSAQLPGLFLTGNALRGVALYECAADAEQTARRVLAFNPPKE
jgi:oxygen-dependent protoporphyrinogen oxidase